MGTGDIDMTIDEIKKRLEAEPPAFDEVVYMDDMGTKQYLVKDIVKFLLEKLEETRIRFEAARSVAIRETTPGPNVIEWIDEEILDEMKRLKENK